MCALRRRATYGWLWGCLTGSFGAPRSGHPTSLQGRPLPAVEVGYPVAQVEGQLYGVEIARPTGASRPFAEVHAAQVSATKLPQLA